VASQRGFTSPNASIPALFWGWVPAGGGLSDPRNEHSCSFRGCVVLEAGRRWVEPRKRAVVLGFGGRGTVVAAREEPDPRKRAFLLGFGVGKVLADGGLSDPRNEHSCSFRGWCWRQAEGGWNPDNEQAAVVLGFGGRGTVVTAREEPDPRKRAFLLGFGVGKWCWQTVGCQIPETSNHAHFGDVCWRQAEGGQNPGNKQSCSASGFGGWL